MAKTSFLSALSGHTDPMFVRAATSTTLNLSSSVINIADESCSEVSSSSPLTSSNNSFGGQPQSPPCGLVSEGVHSPPGLVSVGIGVGMSPATSLTSSDIAVDNLEIWDIDINSPQYSFNAPPPSSTTSSTTSSNMYRNYTPTNIYFSDSSSGRDDLSPPSSVTSYSVDGDIKNKKKGPPRQQEELCLVCGDRASGYHYNALTCEGCKGFFRRSITKKSVYQCKYGKNCEMDMYMRRKCQECRFLKCINSGMRPECVVPEPQCKVNRTNKKNAAKKNIKKEPDLLADDKSQLSQLLLQSESVSPTASMPGPPRLVVKSLTKDQGELINRLVYIQEEFELPADGIIKPTITIGLTDEVNYTEQDKGIQLITNMTVLTVQLIVEFSKRLPGFDSLLRDDQITLLKASSSEVMMLRAARRYDAEKECIIFGNDSPFTSEMYQNAGMSQQTIDSLFDFCIRMMKMKVDNAEYALLTAITIFSERPDLYQPKNVEKIQAIYVETLQAYVQNKWPAGSPMVAKLIHLLVDLRTLGVINSKQCYNLNDSFQLPDILIEIWDLKNSIASNKLCNNHY